MKELKIAYSLLYSPNLTKCLEQFSDPITKGLVGVTTEYISDITPKVGYYSVKFEDDAEVTFFKTQNGQFKYL